MTPATKAPSGRHIWRGVRDELMLNLYPLPFTTIAPAVYHVYLHPEEFETIEPIVPRIVAEVQRALTDEVTRINEGRERTGRRVLARLLQREDLPPIEVPAGGWEIHIKADQNGELQRGQLGIVSTLAMPALPEYGGTPTTRIVRSIVSAGRRTSTTRDVPQEAGTPSRPASAPAGRAPETAEHARLAYEDEQGRHEFVMRKDTLSIGRGGASAWVDVQVVTNSRVSREHVRIRRDGAGRFFIQDVSLWGTTVEGEPLPPAIKSDEGVLQPGAERPLPPRARISLADVVTIDFEAIPEP